jgi:hypothetical protein
MNIPRNRASSMASPNLNSESSACNRKVLIKKKPPFDVIVSRKSFSFVALIMGNFLAFVSFISFSLKQGNLLRRRTRTLVTIQDDFVVAERMFCDFCTICHKQQLSNRLPDQYPDRKRE